MRETDEGAFDKKGLSSSSSSLSTNSKLHSCPVALSSSLIIESHRFMVSFSPLLTLEGFMLWYYASFKELRRSMSQLKSASSLSPNLADFMRSTSSRWGRNHRCFLAYSQLNLSEGFFLSNREIRSLARGEKPEKSSSLNSGYRLVILKIVSLWYSD